jgi:hypothetical protein
MRKRNFVRTLGPAIALAAVLLPRPAHAAEDCAQPLLSTCINSDTLWPHAGPQRFMTVGGVETVQPGQVAFGLVTTYLSRPVVLKTAAPGAGGTEQFAVDNQVNGNFLWSYGVTQRLALDLAMPVTFFQDGAGMSPITAGARLRDTAIRDPRLGVTFAILPRPRTAPELHAQQGRVFGLTGRFVLSMPAGDETQFAGERSAVFAPSISGDYRRGRAFAGVELGMRLRPTASLSGARVGSQITTGVAAGYDILPKELLSATAEARVLYNLPKQADVLQSPLGLSSTLNDKHIIPAEWMVGVRSAPFLSGDVSFSLGGGGAIPIGDPAITRPRMRFLLGITYAPSGRDSDGDGVIDRLDKCPNEMQGPYPPKDGCPHATPPADSPPADATPAAAKPAPGAGAPETTKP